MSDDNLHNPPHFLKDLNDIDLHFRRLLTLLDELDVALYHARRVYEALQHVCERAKKR